MKGGKTILAESAATAKEVEVPAGYLPNMNPYELPIDVILRLSVYLLRH